MKVLILGGVAAGTKTAAKLKRLRPDAQVTLLSKSGDISYAGCGLPYYVGGAIEEKSELIVNTPERYAALTGVEVLTGREAVKLDGANKTVFAKNLRTGGEESFSYDKLVIAVGASPVVPPIEGAGLRGVFTLRTPDDAEQIRGYIQSRGVRRAIVVGGGFIGLEAAENLAARGVSVTVMEGASRLLPGAADPEMADYIRRQLEKTGIRVMTDTLARRIAGEESARAVETAAGVFPAELVLLAVGIRPNTAFLEGSGLQMERGLIPVDEKLAANIPDVYAAGDCARVKNRLTGLPQWSPMGSSANLEGRTLARVLAGEDVSYPGVLGTGVVRLPGGLGFGRTGLGEAEAVQAGFDVVTALAVTDDKAHYYPGSAYFITKLIADRNSRRLLGAQVIGPGAVDKMTDIAVMALTKSASLEDFDGGDFAYAPPFSTAIHPFVQAVYVLLNKLDGQMQSISPARYAAGDAEGWRVVDAGAPSPIPGAFVLDYTRVEGPVPGLGLSEKLLLVCTRGKRAYLLQNRLRRYGYQNTLVLEGGAFFNEVRASFPGGAIPPEEEARVKGLGFLRDKTSPDCFNGRVITRNGKITAQESRAIAEAAERFGSGEIAMTSRLTVEIQGVPFGNIEPLREYLAQAGLETGGTGSKVRPVVSCKGTTCQYGLIDTFELSREIHERFYRGYREVKLPHKFKIAVGGCPNNCVKPDLNDLGIIGQRVPLPELELCRGCKVCQVEKACPIGAASVRDGKLCIDAGACNHCGRCLAKCPFHALERYTAGYRVYIGGRWGKKTAQGRSLSRVFPSREEVLDVVEKAILLFREQGVTGERFADTVARLGFENVERQLLSGDLLARREENLAAQKHMKGGATC
ncbi:MAG: FAD-dependent oxidoreductase [Oscillospiraceae bacterium]|nr:FAD-dependent oxidoreductase [Oscillospiraceae bacterium]